MLKRKPRSDRNHLIYRIVNTETGDVYIGLTVMRRGNIRKSLEIRWRGHEYKAFVEMKNTAIARAFREFEGQDVWTHEALHIVRGKRAAHEFEGKLIRRLKPSLNKLHC